MKLIDSTDNMCRRRRDSGARLLLRRRLDATPDSEHERIVAFKVFSYSGMIARSRSEIDWARDGLDLIDRLGRNSE
ncbi:hypothetical protein CH260_15505 [Rhodococcus sp. 05-2256-B2]|nr:hypothetical protein CH258_20845 [Rhodococcus sp. 05-2256-B4]OZD87381.1 hypothetical protein CH257_25370 [Rhodococcus sp. 05-2256-B3]OZD94832.1 hypothetical protein CH260_15505 [Rhodococcus sp. 05-2256-B2]OZE07915.1 hypothetical protein CH285_04115 [Rhodococcus sp. 05-2256-B1]